MTELCGKDCETAGIQRILSARLTDDQIYMVLSVIVCDKSNTTRGSLLAGSKTYFLSREPSCTLLQSPVYATASDSHVSAMTLLLKPFKQSLTEMAYIRRTT